MNRRYLRLTCAIAGCLSFQMGLLSAEDRIDYRDPANRATPGIATGTIVDETYNTIKMKLSAGGKEKILPVGDVIKILYEMPGAARLEYNPIALAEERQEFQKALDAYKALAPKLTGTDRAKRFVEYKVAMLTASVSMENPANLQVAIDSLKKFIASTPANWQTICAIRQLVALQLRAKDNSGALATIDSWAKLSNLPKELKAEADLAQVDVLFQIGKIKEAKTRAEEISKGLAASDPLKGKIDLYILAGSVENTDMQMPALAKKFQDLIDASSDNSFKAVAYNILGNCYTLKGQLRDAMWSYLWVDVVYNQDRNEHAKALDHLVFLFDSESMKDAERSKIFRDKLLRIRQ